MPKNDITYSVGFQVDGGGIKSELGNIERSLGASLSKIQKEIDSMGSKMGGGVSRELAEGTRQAKILQTALKSATTDKGISFKHLTRELRQAGTNAETMVSAFQKAGMKESLSAFSGAFISADRSLIKINAKVYELQRVLKQSIKYSAAQGVQRAVISGINQAIYWVKELNRELTTIAIVSNKSTAEMDAVFDTVIQKSKELRVLAKDYASAMTIFFQQGLNDAEVQRRADVTIKASKAAGQSVKEMSQQLTAIWNTYHMEGAELERAASIGAKLGANTAVQFKDIAEAMQISAAAASQMGVSYESLGAIIATTGDATQQSASVIGNAFKTIFSRIDQLKIDAKTGGVELGQVSAQLDSLGISILDSSGTLKELDDVIMQVGSQWDTYSSKQQLAIAQAIGGRRQYGQFIALMSNFDKYMANLSLGKEEEGSETLSKQYFESLNSIDSKAMNMAESWKRAFSQVFTEDSIKGFYEFMEGLGEITGDFLKGIGGLPGILGIAAAHLSTKIVPAMRETAMNAKLLQENLTPAKRAESFSRDFQSMMSAQLQARAAQRDNIKGANNKRLYDLETESLEKQIPILEKIGLLHNENNEFIKNGTAAQRAAGEEYRKVLDKAKMDLETAQSNKVNLQADLETRDVLSKDRNIGTEVKYQQLETELGSVTRRVKDLKESLHVDLATAEVELREFFSEKNDYISEGFLSGEIEELEISLTQRVNEIKAKIQEISRPENEIKNEQAGLTLKEKNLEIQREMLTLVDETGASEQERIQALKKITMLLTESEEVLEGNLDGPNEKPYQRMQRVLQDLNEELTKLDLKADGASAGEEQLEMATQEICGAFERMGIAVDGVQGALAETIQQNRVFTDDLVDNQQAIGGANIQIRQTAEALRAVGDIEVNTNFAWEFAEGLTQVGSSVTMVTMGMSSLIDGIENGTLSFSQFVGAMGPLVFGLQGMWKGLSKLKVAYQATIPLQVANMTVIEKETRAKIFNILATKGLTEAERQEQIAKLLNISASKVGNTQKIKEGLVNAGLAGTYDLLKLKIIGATQALWGFFAALMTNPIGWVVAGIAALIGVLVAVNRIINSSIESGIAASKQLSDAAVSANDLSKELKDLGASVRETKEEFDNGTLSIGEYNKKIAELIERAEELNKQNPTLNLTFNGDLNEFQKELENSFTEQQNRAKDLAEQAKKRFQEAMSQEALRPEFFGENFVDMLNPFGPADTRDSFQAMLSSSESAIDGSGMAGGGFFQPITQHFRDDDIQKAAEEVGIDHWGDTLDMSQLAENYDEFIAKLTEINAAAANEFEKSISEVDGWAEYMGNIDLINEIDEEQDYSKIGGLKEEFLDKTIEGQRQYIKEGREAVKFLQEFNNKEKELARLETFVKEKDKVAGYSDQVAKARGEIEKLQAEIAQIEGKNGDTLDKGREFQNLQKQAYSDSTEGGQEIQNTMAGVDLLEERKGDLKGLYSPEEWAEMERQSIELAKQSELRRIGISEELLLHQEYSDSIGNLITQIANFNSSMPENEQTEWFNGITEQLDTLNEKAAALGMGGISSLPETFLLLSDTMQEAELSLLNYNVGLAEMVTKEAEAKQKQEELAELKRRYNEQLQENQESPEIQIDLEPARQAIENLENEVEDLDLEIEIRIRNQMEEQVELLRNGLEGLNEFASNIEFGGFEDLGDAIALNIDQMEQWKAVFPELLSQGEITAEGMLRLNKDTVNEYIDGQRATIEASIDAQIAILEAEKAKVLAKQAVLRAELDMAVAAAKGDRDAYQAALLDKNAADADYNERLNEYNETRVENEDIANGAILKSHGDMIDDQGKNAEIGVQNMAKANAANEQNADKSTGAIAGFFKRVWNAVTSVAKSIANMVKGVVTGFNQDGGESSGQQTSLNLEETKKELAQKAIDDVKGSLGSYDKLTSFTDTELQGFIDHTKGEIDAGTKHIADIDHEMMKLLAAKNKTLKGFKGGGGKGGKGGEGIDPAELKSLEDLINLYRINEAQLKRITIAKKKLNSLSYIGDKEIRNLRTMNELREKEIQLMQEKIIIDVVQAKSSQTKLNKKSEEYLGITAVFTNDGDLQNYGEIMDAIDERIEKAKNAYESLIGADGKISSQNKKIAQERKKEYDEILKQQKELAKLDKEVTESHTKVLESKQKQFEMEQELRKEELKELTFHSKQVAKLFADMRKSKQWEQERLAKSSTVMTASGGYIKDGNVGSRQIENMSYMQNTLKGELGYRQKTMNTIINQHRKDNGLEELSGDLGSNVADFGGGGWETWEWEELEKVKEQMESVRDEWIALNDKMLESIGETFSNWMDRIDRAYAQFDKASSELDNMKSIIQLAGPMWGGKKGRDTLDKISKSQLEVSKNRLQAAKTLQTDAETNLKNMQSTYNSILNMDTGGLDENQKNERLRTLQAMEQDLKDMEDRAAEANEEFMNSFVGSMEQAADLFHQKFDNIMQTFNEKAAGGFGDMDWLIHQMDYEEETQDRYVDEVDSLQELIELQREMEEFDAQEAKTIEGIARLNEDIEKAKERGNKLSRYELDIMKERFNLAKAQAEFEDAREAKNTMRLARDASGNYSYIYSADEKDIEEKGAEVTDSANKIRALTKDQLRASRRGAAEAIQTYQDEMSSLDPNDPEYAEQAAELERQLLERLAYQKEQYEAALNGIKELDNVVTYSEMQNIESLRRAQEMGLEGLITTTQGTIDQLFFSREGHKQLAETVKTTTEEAKQNHIDFQQNLASVVSLAGESLSTLGNDYVKAADGIEEQTARTTRAVQELSQQAVASLQETMGAVSSWSQHWVNEGSKVISQIQAIIRAMQEQRAVELGMEMDGKGNMSEKIRFDKNVDYSQVMKDDWNYVRAQNDWNSMTAPEQDKLFNEWKNSAKIRQLESERTEKTKLDEFSKYAYSRGELFTDSYRDSAWKGNGINADTIKFNKNYAYGDDVEGTYVKEGDIRTRQDGSSYKMQNGRWIKIPHLATGGLVSSSQVVHVAEDGAELVLNSRDTQNILLAVQKLRDLQNNSLSKLGSLAGRGVENLSQKESEIKLEQSVNINADFPGVQVSSEIEQAFDNLFGRAVQYVK